MGQVEITLIPLSPEIVETGSIYFADLFRLFINMVNPPGGGGGGGGGARVKVENCNLYLAWESSRFSSLDVALACERRRISGIRLSLPKKVSGAGDA